MSAANSDMLDNEKMAAYVQTVLGPVAPDALGVTHTHEHILSDLSHIAVEPDDPFEREMFHSPMRMDILGYLSYYFAANLDNLRLDDVDTAISEIESVQASRGRGDRGGIKHRVESES